MAKRVVIITGASSGIGLETSLKFAREGWATYAGFREVSKRNVLAKACQDASTLKNIDVVQLDTTSNESVRKAISYVVQKENRVDVLINNAGIAYHGPIEAFTQEELHSQYEVNFFGVIRCIKAVLPIMRSQRSGRIVNISSGAGVYSRAFMALYSSTKFALEGMTQGLAEEVAPFGIHAIIVQPDATKSNARNSMVPASSPLPNNPYAAANAKANAATLHWLTKFAVEASTASDTIFRAATDEKPQFRYQCTPRVAAFVAAILQDPTGRNNPFSSKL